MKLVVLIPARGGSKGVPGKNIKVLNGKPLIQHTIDAAREICSDVDIHVSSDEVQIINVVSNLGLKVPYIRPAELATDVASSFEVIQHEIAYLESINSNPDVLILLQPTSPFRKGKHILEALALFDRSCDLVVSVKESKSSPYFNLMEEDKNGFLIKSKPNNFTRRQDCPPVFELNGAIYIYNLESLKKGGANGIKKIRKYVMDEMSSHDIDTMYDWQIAELIGINIKAC
ncbi:acylneuraminate cytidylyltransferase family protein [Aquirufa sp. OSTEICH-129V]|uniref:Acylneuraminate cytidylyltransferase family protein n=1 Tax=Aquirufa avitistagni TaxID=3104728 RepID=A0ABW6DHD1_9BACT